MKTVLTNSINCLEYGGGGNGSGTKLSPVSEAAIKKNRESLRSIIWLSATRPTTDRHSLDLSRFDAAPITHLSYLSFEGQGAFPAEG